MSAAGGESVLVICRNCAYEMMFLGASHAQGRYRCMRCGRELVRQLPRPARPDAEIALAQAERHFAERQRWRHSSQGASPGQPLDAGGALSAAVVAAERDMVPCDDAASRRGQRGSDGMDSGRDVASVHGRRRRGWTA